MKKKSKKRKDQSDNKSNDQIQRDLLISAWKARDELYKNLFGDYSHVSPKNYGPPDELLQEEIATGNAELGIETGDPGDPDNHNQHLAVLAYGPDPTRPYWTYVTAGLCSPWVQQAPDEVSGFGCELLIKSPIEASWPAQILRSMAFYIFNHAGTLSPGVRIGLNAPIKAGSDSKLRNVVIWYADEAPDCWYELPSGGFGIFAAIGITDDELRFAESIEEYGTWCIQNVLRQTGSAQITDPDRDSVMQRDDINEIVNATKNFYNEFRSVENSREQK